MTAKTSSALDKNYELPGGHAITIASKLFYYLVENAGVKKKTYNSLMLDIIVRI